MRTLWNKIIFSFVVILISYGCLLAQDSKATRSIRPINNLYLNLLGDASYVSINYERLFISTPVFFLSGKLGLGYINDELNWFSSSPPNLYLTVPHHITGNLGLQGGIHFLEAGLGGTFASGNNNLQYYLYPIIGYRIQPKKPNRLCFRIFISVPFWSYSHMFIPVGVSLGVNF